METTSLRAWPGGAQLCPPPFRCVPWTTRRSPPGQARRLVAGCSRREPPLPLAHALYATTPRLPFLNGCWKAGPHEELPAGPRVRLALSLSRRCCRSSAPCSRRSSGASTSPPSIPSSRSSAATRTCSSGSTTSIQQCRTSRSSRSQDQTRRAERSMSKQHRGAARRARPRQGRCAASPRDLAEVESKLEIGPHELYRYQRRQEVHRHAPARRTASRPSPWSSAWSSSAVAIKGVFEFWQESLVGSVVNLSLFDLRNRFYRNVIHLDVDQLQRAGHARADGPLHQRHGAARHRHEDAVRQGHRRAAAGARPASSSPAGSAGS